MDLAVFVMGLVLFALAFTLAPMRRNDRPGLLQYLPKGASKQTERRVRAINSMLWLMCLSLGLVLMLFGFLH